MIIEWYAMTIFGPKMLIRYYSEGFLTVELNGTFRAIAFTSDLIGPIYKSRAEFLTTHPEYFI